ncbi:MAG: ABC transporter ATP-binding protein [Elusimicrobiota bacterium]
MELVLRGITKSFGNNRILKGIDVTIKEGEFISLLGPSGCGKTTLLRIIAGLEDLGSGEVVLDGQRLDTKPAAKRNVSMVFQSYALYPHMSVVENISLALKLQGLNRGEIAQRVNEAADLLKIKELLARKPAALSGGQRQRVAVARAIVRRPKLFLLDEPLSNLDALLREQTRSELKLLFSRLKTTVIYVTHDQVEAMSMSDRIVLLNNGIIDQQGTPAELYERPSTLFAASFIGNPSMNMADIKVLRGLGVAGLPQQDRAIVGFRPEAVKLCEQPMPGAFPAQAILSEPTGAQTIWTLAAAGMTFKVALARTKPVAQQSLVYIEPTALHCFNEDSHKRA